MSASRLFRLPVAMHTSHILVFFLSLATCAGTTAQQMYKTVGADGKITFSDRPKIESAVQVSEMRGNTMRASKMLGSVKPPEPARAAAPAPSSSAEATDITPEVEAAIMDVMAKAEFSRRFYPLCNSNHASARAFNQAASGWKARNAAAVEQQRKLLMLAIAPGTRAEIESRVTAALNEEMAKVSARTGDERAKWCNGAIAGMANPALDIQEPEMMAIAVKAYKR